MGHHLANSIKECEAPVGSIIETPNGNRYLILPDRRQCYVGNRDMNRCPRNELLPEKPLVDCIVVGNATSVFTFEHNCKCCGRPYVTVDRTDIVCSEECKVDYIERKKK